MNYSCDIPWVTKARVRGFSFSLTDDNNKYQVSVAYQIGMVYGDGKFWPGDTKTVNEDSTLTDGFLDVLLSIDTKQQLVQLLETVIKNRDSNATSEE